MPLEWCWPGTLAMSAMVATATMSPHASVQPARAARNTLEAQVLAELNRLRADPTGYAERLHRYRAYYHARLVSVPGEFADYETEEGVAPLDEAVRFLQHQAPSAPYADSELLGRAARDHGEEQAVDGAIGHEGADGSDPSDRVERRGGGRYVAEVITYGSRTAADVVRQLVVDDGVPDRGHRTILFDPEFRFAGVACAPHPEYGVACVVDLARTPDAHSRWAPMQMASR